MTISKRPPYRFQELSDSLKSALLDQRFQSPRSEQSRKRPAPGAAPAAAAAAAAMPAAAAAPPMNWTSFADAVVRVVAAVSGINMPGHRVLVRLERCVLHLSTLRQSDYDAIPPHSRDQIYAQMTELTDDIRGSGFFPFHPALGLITMMRRQFPQLNLSAAARPPPAAAAAAPAAAPAAAAAAAPPAPVMNWATFSADIRRLTIVVLGWRQSRLTPTHIHPVLDHLQSLQQADYDAINNDIRDEIHSKLIAVIDDPQRGYSSTSVVRLVAIMWTAFPELASSAFSSH